MKIRIAVVIMLSLLGSSACGLIPTPEPTATPTPTNTATATPSPTPTDTPTPTATATATPQSATQLEQLADDSWTFYDNEAGYQFDMAASWYVEDVSGLSITEIFGRTTAVGDELGIESTVLSFIQPEGMRTFGVYLDDSIPDYLSVSFSAAYIEDEGFEDMGIDEIRDRVISLVVNTHDLDPADVGAQLFENQHDVQFGIVLYNFSLTFNQIRIFFKVDGGVGMIIFGFSEENADLFGPDWQTVTRSLQYIE